MTKQEKDWFQKLNDKLAKDADVFSDARYNGIWESVIDKYSDQAHFVYELLQNADDAGATWVRFELHDKELVFRHNGKRIFTVSNPETESEDQQNGKLGHVNAIAAIGMSQKLFANNAGNQIGRFGVVFKSVFRYTNSPRIYDDNIWFRLERRIVPSIIECDYSDRQSGETVFVFPFDKGDAVKSFSEVAYKLRTLRYPLLFLRNLLEILYVINGDEGTYTKECGEWHDLKFQDETFEILPFRTREVHLKHKQYYDLDIQVFSRRLEGGEEVSVGYAIDGDGRPIPKSGVGAFCFFETDVPTGLNFMIHAPFLLTDNRQGIKDDSIIDSSGVRKTGHNERMIDGVAELAAAAIWAFTQLGKERITDSVLEVIPSREQPFCNLMPDNLFRRSFNIIQYKFINVFKNAPVIPSDGKMVLAKSCYWPYNRGLDKLLSNSQLETLFRTKKVNWAFVSYPGISNGLKCQYIARMPFSFHYSSLGGFLFRILGNPISLERILDFLTPQFMQQQTDEWKCLLYQQIVDCGLKKAILAHKNLLPDQNGEVVPAYDKREREQLWLPTEGVTDVHMVDKTLMKNTSVIFLVHTLELKHVEKPSRKQQVLKLIAEHFCCATNVNEYLQIFKEVFGFYMEEPQSRTEIIAEMKKVRSLYVHRCLDDTCEYLAPDELEASPKEVYLKTEDFGIFLSTLPHAYTIDPEDYRCILGETDKKTLRSLLRTLGAHEVLVAIKEGVKGPGINFCLANFRRLPTIADHETAVANCKATWNLLLDFIRAHCREDRSFLNCLMYKPTNEECVVPSETLEALRTSAWIVDSNGILRKPCDIHIEDIDSFYSFDAWPARQLAEAIGLTRLTAETLSDTDREAMEVGRRLKEAGITESDVENFISEFLKTKEQQSLTKGITKGMPSVVSENGENAADVSNQSALTLEDVQHKEDVTDVINMVLEDKRKIGDYEVEEDEFIQLSQLFSGGLTSKDGDDKKRKWQDESKLACFRLFNYLEGQGLEPSMDGHREAAYVVMALYADIEDERQPDGHRGPNIDINNGKRIHVISARAGVAYITPHWWNKVKQIGNNQFEICAITGARTEEFVFIHNRDDLLSLISDNALPVKIRGVDADERMALVSDLFDHVDSETTAAKIYALLKVKSNTNMNKAFEKGFCSDEMAEREVSYNSDL